MLEVMERGEHALQLLNATNSQEAAAVSATVQHLFAQARKISDDGGMVVEDEAGHSVTVGELLGLAEGSAKSGADELQDAMEGALARRRDSLGTTREGLKM